MWTANLRREISDGEQDIFALASFITQAKSILDASKERDGCLQGLQIVAAQEG